MTPASASPAARLVVAPAPSDALGPPSVRGKFFWVGGAKLYVRAVSYGPFAPASHGHQFPERDLVTRDLALMRELGANTIHTFTVPPRWLLDRAAAHGVRVMIGIPWAQHVCFLDSPASAAEIRATLRAAVRGTAGHPAPSSASPRRPTFWRPVGRSSSRTPASGRTCRPATRSSPSVTWRVRRPRSPRSRTATRGAARRRASSRPRRSTPVRSSGGCFARRPEDRRSLEATGREVVEVATDVNVRLASDSFSDRVRPAGAGLRGVCTVDAAAALAAIRAADEAHAPLLEAAP